MKHSALKHFLSLEDLNDRELKDVLYTAKSVKSGRLKYSSKLRGKTLGLLFSKPSTRTRVSFEAGIYQLGGTAIFLTEKEIQLGRGESTADTARVLSRYLDGIIIRTFKHNDIIDFARHSTIPVINGLTDMLHPCQILSDIFTITEKKGSTKGIKLAYIGDGSNNIAASWLLAAGKTGIDVFIAAPARYKPNDNIISLAERFIQESGQGSFNVGTDPVPAISGADIVYADVWVSMGQEKEKEERLGCFKPYQINKALMRQAKKNCLIMHCLPAHPGEEITEEIIYGPQSIIFDQAENRLHAQKALLMHLLK